MGVESYKEVKSFGEQIKNTLSNLPAEVAKMPMNEANKQTNKEAQKNTLSNKENLKKDLSIQIAACLKISVQNVKEFINFLKENNNESTQTLIHLVQQGYSDYGKDFNAILEPLLTANNTKIENQKIRESEKQEVQKLLPNFLEKIQNQQLSLITNTWDVKIFSMENLKYAINNKQNQINFKFTSEADNFKKLSDFRNEHPKSFYRIIKDFIPNNIQAINYLNELPKNQTDWENALKTGASELSQFFQNKKNQKTLAELTGLSQDDLNDTRKIRSFLLTHQDIFDTIIKTFNYDEETKNTKKGEKTKEQILDTSNYTFRIMERYGINYKSGIDDGGTGMAVLINYYQNNKGQPQAKQFCQEYENVIFPQLQKTFNEIKNKYQDGKYYNNLDGFLNDPTFAQKRPDVYSQILTELGHSLNENNKTEELKKRSLTPESIKIGNKLKNTLGEFLTYEKTPEKENTMEKILQGEYYQEKLQLKLNTLQYNPQLQRFFQMNPELSNLLNVENLANLNVSSLAESGKKLLKLIGKIFFSDNALTHYEEISDQLDNQKVVSETVDLVFEEALNDESLFKDFEQGPDFAFDEAENLKLQEIDLTDTYLPKMLGDFDKLHDGSLSQPIEALAKENAKDDTGHEPLKELFKLKDGQNLNEFFTKLHQGLVDKFAKTNKYISLPKDIFTNIFDISEWDEKKEPSFRRGEFKLFLTMNGIPTTHFDTYKQKIEDSVRKRVKAECEKKTEFKENIDTSLHKIMISDRVSYTISKLKDSPFTKGLKLDTSKAENVQIDENLNVTINGTYDGKPCHLCINQDGTVKITAYYHKQGDNMTFDNSPNFLLFQIPSIKEQEEIGYGTLQGLGNRRKEDRKEVYSQLQEHHTIKEEGIEDFPLQKEKGLCFLKIKELLGFTETSFNPENAEYQPVCEFFNAFADCIKSPHIAREINAFLGGLANLQQQVRDGNDWIKENSKSTFDLFDRMPKNQANGLKGFQENPYILVLQHFMKPDGNGYKFNIDDALMYISAFKQGDQVLQARDAKIRGEDGSEQYRIYADTPLTQYLKNLEQKTH